MPRGRKRKAKQLKPVLHIFCEGEKTEPNYLKGYLDRFCPANRTLQVVSIEITKKNTPKQLVDAATKRRKNKDTPKSDVIWVVYDREAPGKYCNEIHCKAVDKARANDVHIAISNVCFEVWILLHLTYTTAQYDTCDDFVKNNL